MVLNKAAQKRVEKALRPQPSRRAPKVEIVRPNFWVRFVK